MSVQTKISRLLSQIKHNQPLFAFIRRFLEDHNNSQDIKMFLVGGCVRDAVMGRRSKDIDIVVTGLNRHQLGNYLDGTQGKSIDVVSRNFGVFKFIPPNGQEPVDIALPRQDIYQAYGLGHKDVEVKFDQVTIAEDLSRREITINAMAIDLNTHELLDLHNGLYDIENKVIRSVGDPYQRFVLEDPTRMMRAIRFAAALNFTIDPKTLACIKKHHPELTKPYIPSTISNNSSSQPIERVAKEVIAAEFIKGFAKNPEKMIEILDHTGVYRSILNDELITIWEGMKTTEQPANFHYEGNVWKHTLLSLHNIKNLNKNQLSLTKSADINLKLAVFFHDWGKVNTIKIDDNGQYTYYNHPAESARYAKMFINHMQLYSPFPKNHPLAVKTNLVAWLAHHHMFPNNTPAHELRDRTVIKYYLEKKRWGMKLLQIGYIDACSSIKSQGPQDFTGIKRSLKKIKEVASHLDQMNRKKKIYPVTGLQIKKLIRVMANKADLSPAARKEINLIVNNPKGSPKIGELKELILEDALQNPDHYRGAKMKLISASTIIENFFELS